MKKTKTKARTKPMLCQKLTYNNSDEIRVIFGITEKQDSDFLYFKTGKNVYQISRKAIVTLEPTNRIFQEAQ